MPATQLRRLIAHILLLAVAVAAVGALGLMTLFGTGLAGEQPGLPPIPEVPEDRALTVVVRGWLWDPGSRRYTPPLVEFPRAVNEVLENEYGLETEYMQFDWTRVPKDVFGATEQFTYFARQLADRAARRGVCVNFVGHSGGAMMIYWAATEGVTMGFMGTLGLPLIGAEKPPSVTAWANFYTDTHIDDIAGWMWGRYIGSDLNINLKMRHRDFWGASEVHQATADGIARAWDSCRPGGPIPRYPGEDRSPDTPGRTDPPTPRRGSGADPKDRRGSVEWFGSRSEGSAWIGRMVRKRTSGARPGTALRSNPR